MRIPEIRERLHELADLHGIDELHDLAEATRRRFNGRTGRRASVPVTPELNEALRAYMAAFPDMTLHEVSQLFRLNQGRVSEALRGKRA